MQSRDDLNTMTQQDMKERKIQLFQLFYKHFSLSFLLFGIVFNLSENIRSGVETMEFIKLKHWFSSNLIGLILLCGINHALIQLNITENITNREVLSILNILILVILKN